MKLIIQKLQLIIFQRNHNHFHPFLKKKKSIYVDSIDPTSSFFSNIYNKLLLYNYIQHLLTNHECLLLYKGHDDRRENKYRQWQDHPCKRCLHQCLQEKKNHQLHLTTYFLYTTMEVKV